MKKLSFISLFCFIYMQNTSPMLEGMGENRSIIDPAMVAIGDSWYFSGRMNDLGLKSISSLYKTNFSQISSSMSFISTSSKNIGIQKDHRINYINFLTPVGINQSIGFGMFSKTRTDFHITDTDQGIDNVMYNGQFFSSDFIYFGKGGISNFFVTYSKLINKNYSIGIEWDIEFGNLFLVDSILTNRLTIIDYNTFQYNLVSIERTESKYKYNGNSIGLFGTYMNKFINLTSSLKINNDLIVINDKRYHTSNSILFSGMDLLSTSSQQIKYDTNIESFGLGVEYKLKKNKSCIVEYNYLNNINYNKFNIFNNKKGIINKISIGYFMQYDNNENKIWNSLIFRSGLYYKQINKIDYDYGLTIGFGIEYFNNKSIVDLGIKYGTMKKSVFNFNDEKYLEFVIGVISSDKWFTKRKRK